MSASFTVATTSRSFYRDWRVRLKALILSNGWARNLGDTPITPSCLSATAWSNGVLQLIIRGIGMRPKFIRTSVVWADDEAIREAEIDWDFEEAREEEQALLEYEKNREFPQSVFEDEALRTALMWGFWIDEGLDYNPKGDKWSDGISMAGEDYVHEAASDPDWQYEPFWDWIEPHVAWYLCHDPRDASDYFRVTGRKQIVSTKALHPSNQILDIYWQHDDWDSYEAVFAKAERKAKKYKNQIAARAVADRYPLEYAKAHVRGDFCHEEAWADAVEWACENVDFFDFLEAPRRREKARGFG